MKLKYLLCNEYYRVHILRKGMVINMKNIVIVGFMCSGKSTVGRKLAKKINYKFIDTDQWISNEMNLSIDEIFDKKGEDYFRGLETNTVKHFSENLTNAVLSTGGGLSVRKENLTYLKEIGTIVYLKVSKNSVLKRLNPNIVRPLLEQEDREEIIEDMLNIRNPIYNDIADIVIDTNNKSIDTVVNEVMDKLSIK